MATLTSKLIISLVDRVSGPARAVQGSLQRVNQQGRTHAVVMQRHARETGRAMTGMATSAAAAGYGLYSFLNATKEFNEAEFGYTFARIPDHFKGLRLDMESLKTETKEATDQVRKTARDLGLVPKAVMAARTEVEKVGKSGAVGESMWMAALGLSMSDAKMPSDIAVKYLNSMYNAYEKQRLALAARMGMDLNDPKQREFTDRQWLKGTAAKSAFAAAKSSLDPGDLVAGARQYAPQWASLGMTPEETLGAIAHGSNFGFDAPSLGTAFKSWANRLVKPTAGGLQWMNTLGMDRSKWTGGFGAAAPSKASTALNSLLGGQLYTGKGGNALKARIRGMLDKAAQDGTTATPEFQGKLSSMIQKRLGKGWAGKADEIAEAVSNATLVASGDINVFDFIREGLAKGMSRAAMLEMLEGRHIARNTPMFDYFDALVEMVKGLEKIDATHLDAVMEARKGSRAGRLQALMGSWEDLFLTLQDSGLNDTIVSGLKSAVDFLASLNPQVVKFGTTLGLIAAVALPATFAVRGLLAALRLMWAGAKGIAAFATGSLAAGAGGAAAARGANLAKVFGVGAGAAGAVASTKAGRALAAGMAGAGKAAEASRVGSKMIAGMSTAGAATIAAGTGAGTLGKIAKVGAKGLGRLFLPLSVGFMAWDAWEGYQRTGTVTGAALNALTLGMYSGSAEAAPANVIAGAGSAVASGNAGASVGADTGAQAQTTAASAQIAVAQIRSIVGAVDLRAEGQRIMETLAAGVRDGSGAVAAAAREAGAAQIRNAVRGAYSDGAR